MKTIITENIKGVKYVGTATYGTATSAASWAIERYTETSLKRKNPRSGEKFHESGDFVLTESKSLPFDDDGAASTAASFKWDDKLVLPYEGDDSVAPTMVSGSRTNNTTLVVTLSEGTALNTVTKANAGGFTVNETGNVEITYAVSAIARGSATNKIVLTVANMSLSSTAGVTIKYTAGGDGTVKDAYGNALATNATGVLVAAW